MKIKIKRIIITIIICHFIIIAFLSITIIVDSSVCYKKLGKIASQINENYEFLYYNDIQFYYKGEKYFIGDILEDSHDFDIQYINNYYFIYSCRNNQLYEYYSINENGENTFLFSSHNKYIIGNFYDSRIYFENNKCFYLYDIKKQMETAITIDEFYLKAFGSKYTVLYNDGYIITDTSCNVSKKIQLSNLCENNLIKEMYDTSKKSFFGPRLEIKCVEVKENNIYINISADNINCVTIKYDFDLEKVIIVDKACWKYLERLKSFNLNNDVCRPLEYLLSKEMLD